MPAPPNRPTPFSTGFNLNKQDRTNQVYVGPIYTGGTPTGAQQWVDIDALKGQWTMLSPRATEKFMSDAQKYSGYGDTPVPMNTLSSVWSAFVDLSYQIQKSTGELVTPLEAYDWWANKTGRTAQERATAGGGGGGVSTSVQVNLTDPSSARGLVENALSQYLGRRPDADEYRAFSTALRRAEMRNPTRSTSVRGGGTTQTVTQGGLDRQQFTREFARAQEGTAETAAATTLLDSFLQVIGE
jgi:hypothetical protein